MIKKHLFDVFISLSNLPCFGGFFAMCFDITYYYDDTPVILCILYNIMKLKLKFMFVSKAKQNLHFLFGSLKYNSLKIKEY